MTTATLTSRPARSSRRVRNVNGVRVVLRRDDWHSRTPLEVQIGSTFVRSATPAEAVRAIRQGVHREKHRRGLQATANLWTELCDRSADSAREHRRATWTAADLLRDATTRRLVYNLIETDRKYSADLDDYARRKPIAEAREILARRTARRNSRGGASPFQAGRYAAQCTPKHVAAKIGDPKRKLKATYIRKQLGRPEVVAELSDDGLLIAASRCTLGKRQHRRIAEQRLQARRPSEALVRLVAEAIGTIEEQTERDLAEMVEDKQFEGKQGRNHWYQEDFVDRIQWSRDFSAALVTVKTVKSWGGSGYGGADYYGKQGGVGFRAYLILRDSTRGSAHVLRVAPKYGNAETQFFGRAADLSDREWKDASPELLKRAKKMSADERRIHAAVASTFELRAGDYEPAVEA